MLGEVAIGLSHEINNPLTVIESQIALLERHLAANAASSASSSASAKVRAEIRRIESHLQRLHDMAEAGAATRARSTWAARA